MNIRYLTAKRFENGEYKQKYYIQVKRFGFLWTSVKNLNNGICYFDTLSRAIFFAKNYYSHFIPTENLVVRIEKNYRIVQEKFVSGNSKYTIQRKIGFFWVSDGNTFNEYETALKSLEILRTKDIVVMPDINSYLDKNNNLEKK